jgi:hypothetical protein
MWCSATSSLCFWLLLELVASELTSRAWDLVAPVFASSILKPRSGVTKNPLDKRDTFLPDLL